MTPVILSGGSGTRLWPVSREFYPKQFCEFFDRSFLLNTWDRVKVLGEPLVVTLRGMETLTEQTLRTAGLRSDRLLLEPMGKNTAAAVALACLHMERAGQSDEVLGVFPADHLVEDSEAFLNAVRLAEKAAESGYLVTLGIRPRYAATGFGYIECTDELLNEGEGGTKAFRVSSFREKPKQEVAEEYFRSGRHAWNAGIFVFKVSSMVKLFEEHLPEAWERMGRIELDYSNLKHVYANLEAISIDHGIAEKMDRLACIPCEMGWSDVGSWDEVSRISEEARNLRVESKAKVFRENSSSSFVYSQSEKTVGLVDAEDLIVVDTADALLVTKKGRSEKLKSLVGQIRQAGLSSASEHLFEKRPWGQFEVLKDDPQFKVKRIEVDPGEALSYQSHEKRDETWVIVEGRAEFTLNDEVVQLVAGQTVQIPRGAKHRIGNPGTSRVVFIEVQTGDYFGEDDIRRYEDKYQRG